MLEAYTNAVMPHVQCLQITAMSTTMLLMAATVPTTQNEQFGHTKHIQVCRGHYSRELESSRMWRWVTGI